MEELIAQYIKDDYLIQCNSWEEIKIAKDSVVECFGWSRTSGENMQYPYVGKENSSRVCGYRVPSTTKVISFTDLTSGTTSDDEIENMDEVL